MIPKEVEPAMDLDVPEISLKTPIERLREWSSNIGQNERTTRIAKDIISNAKELLVGRDINLDLVLEQIKTSAFNSIYVGHRAIATSYARTIGSIGLALGCSMHDPQLVYLSGVCLSHSVKDKNIVPEGFRETMIKVTNDYGANTLLKPEVYMPILQYLFAIRGERASWVRVGTGKLLQENKIDEAYRMVSLRDDFETKLRLLFPKTTTSSILTPPKFGI